MNDIIMCEGKDCPLKEKCHRYTGIKDPYGQSFFIIPPHKQGKCEYFWDNSNRIKKFPTSK